MIASARGRIVRVYLSARSFSRLFDGIDSFLADSSPSLRKKLNEIEARFEIVTFAFLELEYADIREEETEGGR